MEDVCAHALHVLNKFPFLSAENQKGVNCV